MASKWSGLKIQAISLRKQGKSLPYIHSLLGIPKSTLNYWFRNINLTTEQKKVLNTNWKNGLIKARSHAVKWHNAEKEKRLQFAENEALNVIHSVNTKDTAIIEIALALLYLGEGTKAKDETGIGSSNPDILKFFISGLRGIYNVPLEDIRCELHLRADQNPEKIRAYWSKELKVPKKNFTKPYLDQRTKGSITYDSYKGVCLVRCGRVAIQRKLVYIARHFCSITTEDLQKMRD